MVSLMLDIWNIIVSMLLFNAAYLFVLISVVKIEYLLGFG
jgi:hypothetical protein